MSDSTETSRDDATRSVPQQHSEMRTDLAQKVAPAGDAIAAAARVTIRESADEEPSVRQTMRADDVVRSAAEPGAAVDDDDDRSGLGEENQEPGPHGEERAAGASTPTRRRKKRSLRSRLWNKKRKRKLRRLVLRFLYGWWRTVLPIAPGRIVLASDSRGSLSGNLEYIAQDIAKRFPEREVITLLKPGLKVRRSRHDAFRLPRLFATAELIIVDDYYPIIYPLSLRKGTTLAQVWHAAGAFKLVGYSRANRPGGTLPGSNSHRGYSFVTVSSESVRTNYADAFNVAEDIVKPLGVPRTDMFFDAERVARTKDRVRAELGLSDGDRVVLYAPTFRGKGQRTAHFDLSRFDWEEFRREVGPDRAGGRTVVLLKQHPFVRPLPPQKADELGFRDVSRHREINDLLLVADVLVTDYSSVIFEYALLGRPVVFFTPDLEEYIEHRDFYYPFETYLVGPVTRTTAALGAAVREALDDGVEDRERYAEFVERFVGACDGHSTQRVTDKLLEAAHDRRRARSRRGRHRHSGTSVS